MVVTNRFHCNWELNVDHWLTHNLYISITTDVLHISFGAWYFKSMVLSYNSVIKPYSSRANILMLNITEFFLYASLTWFYMVAFGANIVCFYFTWTVACKTQERICNTYLYRMYRNSLQFGRIAQRELWCHMAPSYRQSVKTHDTPQWGDTHRRSPAWLLGRHRRC